MILKHPVADFLKVSLIVLVAAIFLKGKSLKTMSRQEWGARNAREGGNVMQRDLYTDEQVVTGKESSQVIRRYSTIAETEVEMARMTVEDGNNGKVLSNLLVHPAIRGKQ